MWVLRKAEHQGGACASMATRARLRHTAAVHDAAAEQLTQLLQPPRFLTSSGGVVGMGDQPCWGEREERLLCEKTVVIMIRFVMKRRIMNYFTGQPWQSLQRMSRMSSCPVQLGCLTGVGNLAIRSGCSQLLCRVPSGCSRLLSGKTSNGCMVRLQPLHRSPASHQQQRRPEQEQSPRELDLLRYDMKDLLKGPKPALYLGFCGLLPFLAPPLVMAITELYFPDLAYAQVAYGASILSFLGGARWGFALPEGSPAKPDWLNLGNSVVPSLLAWVALMFRDSITEATMMVVMGLGISLHYDLALLPGYPSWFKALRTVLTLVATFSLVATLMVKGVYPEKKLSLWD
ncbi:hypothetical protein AAFF_G00108110 [Aldrovandia affinis]|uniref:Transmembrane protein 69 n=1 Tax=Aldrovandia affinis TaxID=143900 RepID=A0AAD7WAY4_9TELE|nr:hypothetical protein AAFF_G00108110 [Aldrovandia affinis]